MSKEDLAKSISKKIDTEPLRSEIGKSKSIYSSVDDLINWRTGKDRRNFKYTAYIPERRYGNDRRKRGKD
jgi:hypothetical protein